MKAKRNLEIVINYLGVELVVNFEIDGNFIPHTCDYPAEHPELNITKVFAGDMDITAILLEPQMDDLYELLNDKLEL